MLKYFNILTIYTVIIVVVIFICAFPFLDLIYRSFTTEEKPLLMLKSATTICMVTILGKTYRQSMAGTM